MGRNKLVIGALIIAMIVVFALPIAFLISGGMGAAAMGTLLVENAEATHPGSELIETNI